MVSKGRDWEQVRGGVTNEEAEEVLQECESELACASYCACYLTVSRRVMSRCAVPRRVSNQGVTVQLACYGCSIFST